MVALGQWVSFTHRARSKPPILMLEEPKLGFDFISLVFLKNIFNGWFMMNFDWIDEKLLIYNESTKNPSIPLISRFGY